MGFINFKIDYKIDDKTSVEIGHKVLGQMMMLMKQDAIRLAPADSNELRTKIQLFEKNSSEWELISMAKYSEAIEFGTVPFWAPIQPLKEWAARKLSDEDIGYAIQKKIAREGISAHPFMRPAVDLAKINLPIVSQRIKSQFN